MTDGQAVPEGWKWVDRPPSLFRRFEFGSYGDTRAFLDRLAALSEQTGLYPDLGFGRTHVNVTVHAGDPNMSRAQAAEFAARVSALVEPKSGAS